MENCYSIWLDAMERIKGIQPQMYDQFKRANSSCTYFVPSDKAFKQLGNAKLQKLLEDRNYLTKVILFLWTNWLIQLKMFFVVHFQTLQNHIVDNMLLAESFMPDLQYTVRTKGNPINIMRKNNRILVRT